jgi:hypothetical protein
VRIHRSSGLRYWFSASLARLWRELHPHDPVQLQLTFRNAGKKESARPSLDTANLTVLPLLALSHAHLPEFIRVLADPEKLRTYRDTTRETQS